jgi:hypothetical protein
VSQQVSQTLGVQRLELAKNSSFRVKFERPAASNHAICDACRKWRFLLELCRGTPSQNAYHKS